MRFKISNQVLVNSLKVLSKLKDKQICVLVKDGRVTFEKSSPNTTVKVSAYTTESENGITSISIGTAAIIKKLGDGDIVLTENKIIAGSRVIGYLGDNIKLGGLPEATGLCAFWTTEKELIRMLEVKYTVAQDETRPILAGVCFNKNETCAVDGYRLSLRRGSYESEAKFVVNKETIEVLHSVLGPKGSREVRVYYEEKIETVTFIIGSAISITGKTLPGEYIKYKSVIPEEHNYLANVDAEQLKAEIKLIEGLKTNLTRLHFRTDALTFSTDQCIEEYDEDISMAKTRELQIIASNDYKEKYRIWAGKKAIAEKRKLVFKQKCPEEKIVKNRMIYKLVPVATIKSEVNCITKFDVGNEFNIAVNTRYLIEAIKHCRSERIEFRMISSISPIVITADGYDLEMVLPVKVVD